MRDAVGAGQPTAQYELAMRLFEGRGLPKDQPAAARWFERAASLGLAPAQYRLGSMYEKGIGVTRDPAAAKRWYLKAAEAGNARAAHNLAAMDTDPGRAGRTIPRRQNGSERRGNSASVTASTISRSFMRAGSASKRTWGSRGYGSRWPRSRATRTPPRSATRLPEKWSRLARAAMAAFSKFKAEKPDPAANEVAAPPGGWDAKTGSSSLASRPPTRLIRKRLFELRPSERASGGGGFSAADPPRVVIGPRTRTANSPPPASS